MRRTRLNGSGHPRRPRCRPAPGIGPCSVLVAWLLLGCGADRTTSQECVPGCTIELRPLVSLGGGEEGWVGATFNVARGSRFYYVAGATVPPSEIHVFDLDGSFVRTIGGPGQGPGEYQWIRALRVSEGDTLHVFDVLNDRHTVVAPDFSVVRTRPLPGEIHDGGALPAADGHFLINASIPSAEAIGYPLHLVDPDGDLVRSFGSDPPRAGFNEPPSRFRRAMAWSRAGGIWAAHPREYRIERWTTAGERVQVLRIEADWMEGDTPGPRRDHDAPLGPPPRSLLSIWEDDDGHLWVTGRIPASRWQDAIDGARIVDRNGWAHTVIEVIDPETESRLARRVVPSFAGLLDPIGGYLYTYRESEEGIPTLDMWEIAITLDRR